MLFVVLGVVVLLLLLLEDDDTSVVVFDVITGYIYIKTYRKYYEVIRLLKEELIYY